MNIMCMTHKNTPFSNERRLYYRLVRTTRIFLAFAIISHFKVRLTSTSF